MQAVILAAGTGSRLAEVSGGAPKCLLPIGNRPLIEHQLEALADAGIGHVLVVAGYKADEVRAAMGNRVSVVENTRFEETNSLYSLFLAREWVKGPFVLMNSDLLFHPDILHRLLARKGNALAFDPTSSDGEEKTKVAIRDGVLIDLGKDLPPELSRGESLGLLCFDGEGAASLFARAAAMVKNGGEKSWVMEAIRSACPQLALRGVNVAGLPWVEIDFPFDLNRAQKEVWPAIAKSRWKRTVRWRTSRWLASALGALLLVAAGWMISATVHEQNTVWATVPAEHGTGFILALTNGNQQWWMTGRAEPLRATVRGPAQLRIELRLVLASESDAPGRYVVQVSLNGRPHTWEVFKAATEADVVTDEFVVSDRDRMEITLPEGTHTVEVRLLAGTSDRLLARLRCPEPDSPEENEEEN